MSWPHFSKRFKRRGTDALGRRIGGQQFGMLCFEGLQFTEQAVEFRVGNDGVVQRVIAVIVLFDFGAQLRDTRGGDVCRDRHQENNLRA